MIVGFTGTRQGMSEGQKEYLAHELCRLGATELHHGCCLGADKEAHDIARRLGIKTEGHPPKSMSQMAECDVDFMHPAKAYLERNRDIVNACAILFVAPRKNAEELRSGTWATFRYADRIGKDIIMIER